MNIKFVKMGRDVQINDSVKENLQMTAELDKNEDIQFVIKRLKSLLDEHMPRTK